MSDADGKAAARGAGLVVALVCSSGGLEALRAVLSRLPQDLPAALIVLQHTSPQHPSALAPVLDRECALAVREATEGDRLKAGRVLVAPSARHTLITAQETITLIPSGDRPPYRPSADLLLTSLGLAVGARAVAVVLSGQGNDAATGATAIDHLGGTVIVASPATSTSTPMPQATIDRDHITDYVVPLDDVASLLIALTTAPVLED